MLSHGEIKTAEALGWARMTRDKIDERHENYFFLEEKLKSFGLAVPAGMEIFEVPMSWPKVAVNGILNRSQLKDLLKTDPEGDASELQELFDANQLASQINLFNQDKAVFGRAFWSVGSNPDDPSMPLITPEAPRELSVHVDRGRRRIDAALRTYRVDAQSPFADELEAGEYATLYFPDQTIWMWRPFAGKWRERSRDVHNLGVVPIIMSLNQQMTGRWTGRSQMEPVIPLTEMASRELSNLQFASETTAAPRKYAIGMQDADFRDAKTGELLSRWEAYINAVWITKNKDAKIGQLPGANLNGFIEVIEMLGKQASVATGMPAAKFGITTANPSSEGAVVADEIDLIRHTDRFNAESGTALGWAIDLARRFKNGKWPAVGDRTVVQWHNPATPTEAQRADALSKLTGGKQILSVEGAWDEMGWSEPRKQRERQRLQDEQLDALFMNGGVEDLNAEPAPNS